MHRDIKLENILLNVDDRGNILELRLGDFGYACEAKQLDSTNEFYGTIPFMAPE